MKIKEWFKSFFAGAAMGVANSIPGVSGGTIAVILKIYKKFVDAISGLLKHFVKSFLILLPIVLGIIVAAIPCFILFKKAFDFFAFGIVSLFAGLIIGSFPSIYDEVRGEKAKPKHYIIAAITCIIAVTLGVLSIVLRDVFDMQSLVESHPVWFYFVVVLIGFIGSISLIVPGISGSMMLVVLGFYYPLLKLVSDTLKQVIEGFNSSFWPNVLLLVCFGIGIIVGFVSMAKLMGYLLDKHHQTAFYAIIGFIIGSTITLFVNNQIWSYYEMWGAGQYHLPIWLEILLGVILLIGGAILSYMLVRLSRKRKIEEEENTPVEEK